MKWRRMPGLWPVVEIKCNEHILFSDMHLRELQKEGAEREEECLINNSEDVHYK